MSQETQDPKWSPPVELTPEEAAICKRLERTGKLFPFLRRIRHQLFDARFQAELDAMYASSPRGTRPLPPAMLAMVILLQAYQRLSDADAVEATVSDLRWQMVLGCMGATRPAFSQSTLCDFRHRLVNSNLDRRLIERTVEIAKESMGFGAAALRLALDSAPLWGLGRVEDTFNLIGHALEILLECTAKVVKTPAAELATCIGLNLVGQSSLKAALDIDWDEPGEQGAALQRLLNEVELLRNWVTANITPEMTDAPLAEALTRLARVIEQDLEPDPEGGGKKRIKQGVAADRQISISDGEMRHGRKSKERLFNGYKRHIVQDLDSGLILAAEVLPANRPEAEAAEALQRDVERYKVELGELHADRGYLNANWLWETFQAGKEVFSKPWNTKGRDARFTKADFTIDLHAGKVTCPAGESAPIQKGKASFAAAACDACPLRDECTQGAKGRGRCVTLHEHEALLIELRKMKKTPEGRARLRERVRVEHGLARVCRRQGLRARYRGARLNVFDLRRVAAVENLHAIKRMEKVAA